MRKNLKFLTTLVFTGLLSMILIPKIGKAELNISPNITVSDLPGKEHVFADTTDCVKNGTFITVKVPKNSIVEYGKKMFGATQTQKDDTEGDMDIYKFSIPGKLMKNGGKRYIFVTPPGEIGSEWLSLKFQKAYTIPSRQSITCKPSLDTSDALCEYGKITAKENDKELTDYTVFTTDHLLNLKVSKTTTPAEWNKALKPLLREGATVYAYSDEYEQGNHENFKETFYTTQYYQDDIGADLVEYLTFETKGEAVNREYKLGKLKITKQKSAPKVKLDTVKGTISTTAKMQLQHKASGSSIEFSDWENAKVKMKLTDITKAAVVAEGLELNIRIQGTDKRLPSAYKTIFVPSRGSIDLSKIEMSGPVTNASLKVLDVDKNTNPYEYTTETPSETTKWKPLTSKGVVFTKKTALDTNSKVYVRQKAMNATYKNEYTFRMPSTIAVVTYTSSDWICTENPSIY